MIHLKLWKARHLWPRISYPARFSLIFYRKIKIFTDKKLKNLAPPNQQKGTSLGRKKSQLETEDYEMTKGKHTVKVRKSPTHKYDIKTISMRGGEC